MFNYCNKNKKKPRIFMGFNEIAGYYRNISEGFRQLGLEYCFVNYFPNQFAFNQKENTLFLVKAILFFRKELNQKKISKLKKIFYHEGLVFCVLSLFIWALCRYDVFIFGYRTSFFSIIPSLGPFKELPILKKLGKKIIFIFHGSDTRPPYLNGAFLGCSSNDLIKTSNLYKTEINIIEQYADYIINHQPSSQFHSNKMIKWLNIGLPFDSKVFSNIKVNENSNALKDKKINILHCPSRLKEKGTPIIKETLKELENQGYHFEYVEISGKPNIEVIQAIQEADFIIDELYSDTPMAGFAVEAAWFGKPCIVTGFEIDKVISEIDSTAIPPSLWGNPGQLKELIIDMLENQDLRIKLGKKAQEFVQNNWSSKKVAERILKLIENDFPESWYFDPKDITYSHGWGMDLEERKILLKKILEQHEPSVLKIDDKPKLKKILLESI